MAARDSRRTARDVAPSRRASRELRLTPRCDEGRRVIHPALGDLPVRGECIERPKGVIALSESELQPGVDKLLREPFSRDRLILGERVAHLAKLSDHTQLRELGPCGGQCPGIV
jgi:hypothetical protein